MFAPVLDPAPLRVMLAPSQGMKEMAGDAAGKKFYRETYQPQGFAVVKPQPVDYELPDLSEPKPKAEPKADAKDEKKPDA